MIYLLFMILSGDGSEINKLDDYALCHYPEGIYRTVEGDVTAILEFNGLEHTFLSGINCPNSRTVEVVKGLAIKGRSGDQLHRNIIESYKKSTVFEKFVVEFKGHVSLKRINDGRIVAEISDISFSRMKKVPQNGKYLLKKIPPPPPGY